MKLNLSAITMRYREVGDVTWVMLVIVDEHGEETIIADTAVDAREITVQLLSSTHQAKDLDNN